MLKVHVQLSHGKDAERYAERHRKGLEPDRTPYGFHLAEADGYEVSFSKDGRRGLIQKIVRKVLDFDLVHAWRNRERMSRADAIWTMTEGEGFAVALLMRLGLAPRKPVICNAVWLLDRWRRLTWPRRALYRFLSRDISVLTVHSNRCLPLAQKAFPGLRSQLMLFGVNTDHFQITPPRASTSPVLHVVSAGTDRTRDWETLLAAFGGDERFRVSIACRWLSRKAVAGHPNVTLVEAATATELRALYLTADVIAIPMIENVFSGITVALEAAALGKPVLSSRTGGVPTYFAEDQVIYAPPGDPAALREALLRTTAKERRTIAGRAQRRFLEDDYSTRGLIGRYGRLTRELLRSPAAVTAA